MKKFLLVLTSLLLATNVHAQSPVTVVGTAPIPGNCAAFFSTTQIKDAGVTCNGGGGGTAPGGSNLQIQYNNAGAFGGLTDIQVTARIQAATSSLSGALPAWPNSTTTFFRGDGTYATLNAAAVSGLGSFATQNFATPPAIGSITPAAGSFSVLTDTGITGSTQCVQVNSSGLLSGTGSGCGGSSNNSNIIYVANLPNWNTTCTNNASVINTAIATLGAAGGGTVVLPAGNFSICTTITMQVDGVTLAGAAPTPFITGPPRWGTQLGWTGGSVTSMVALSAVSGGGNTSLKGCGVRDLSLSGAGSVAFTLSVFSAKYCNFSGLNLEGATSFQAYFSSLATLSDPDTQNINFTNSVMSATGSANGMGLDGTSTANTSYNIFNNLTIFHVNGGGIDLLNADNNAFYNIRIYASGSGNWGVVFSAGSTAAFTARNNHFFHLYASEGVYAEGTEANTAPSSFNTIDDYDAANSAPTPQIGTGVTFTYHTNTEYVSTNSSGISVFPMGNGATMLSGFAVLSGNSGTTISTGWLFANQLMATVSIDAVGIITATAGAPKISLAPSTGVVTLVNTESSPQTLFWTVIGK